MQTSSVNMVYDASRRAMRLSASGLDQLAPSPLKGRAFLRSEPDSSDALIARELANYSTLRTGKVDALEARAPRVVFGAVHFVSRPNGILFLTLRACADTGATHSRRVAAAARRDWIAASGQWHSHNRRRG